MNGFGSARCRSSLCSPTACSFKVRVGARKTPARIAFELLMLRLDATIRRPVGSKPGAARARGSRDRRGGSFFMMVSGKMLALYRGRNVHAQSHVLHSPTLQVSWQNNSESAE